MKKLTTAFCGLLMASAASAIEFDLGISEHSVNVGTNLRLNDATHMSGEFLFHEDNGRMANWGVFASGGSGGFSAAVGIKAMAMNHRNDDDFSWGFAPGASLGVQFTHSFRIEAEYHYAPSVLSFNKTNNMGQFDSRFAFSPLGMTNAQLYVGYRDVNYRMSSDRKHTIHDGVYFGMKINL